MSARESLQGRNGIRAEREMADLKKPELMYLKAILFVAMASCASAILLCRDPSWKVALLIAVVVWASARAYYFMFYVIEKYLDSSYRFSGIGSLVVYLLAKRKRRDKGEMKR